MSHKPSHIAVLKGVISKCPNGISAKTSIAILEEQGVDPADARSIILSALDRGSIKLNGALHLVEGDRA